VPTDPYVPADPDAQPRQQQNLPPGVALPPATDWRPDRPGDIRTPDQPEGGLFGNPGPNVGYAYTLAQRAAERFVIGPYEHIDDVIAVVAETAGKRAAMYGRAPVMADIDRAALLLGYDGSGDASFTDARQRLVQEAGHAYRRRRAVVDAVPENLLRSATTDFGPLLAEWRERFASEPQTEPTM
jgi:hypothetical protein